MVPTSTSAPLYFQAVPVQAPPPSNAQMQLPNAEPPLQVSQLTVNVPQANPVADIIHAVARCVLFVAAGATLLLFAKRTIETGGPLGNIQTALNTIATIGK